MKAHLRALDCVSRAQVWGDYLSDKPSTYPHLYSCFLFSLGAQRQIIAPSSHSLLKPQVVFIGVLSPSAEAATERSQQSAPLCQVREVNTQPALGVPELQPPTPRGLP